MKYTRYDLKRRKNDNLTLVVILISILVASYLLGTGLSNMFIKNQRTVSNDISKKPNPDNVKEGNNGGEAVKIENVTLKFICLQNGFFEKKENAEELRKKVNGVLPAFSVQEGSGTRVVSGIFREDDVEKNVQLLKDNGIAASKKAFEINKSNLCDAEIAETVNGYIKILTRLLEKDVNKILTEEFKKYVNSLEKVDEKSANYAVLEEIKKHVNALPQELTKDKMAESYSFIYSTLKNATGK